MHVLRGSTAPCPQVSSSKPSDAPKHRVTSYNVFEDVTSLERAAIQTIHLPLPCLCRPKPCYRCRTGLLIISAQLTHVAAWPATAIAAAFIFLAAVRLSCCDLLLIRWQHGQALSNQTTAHEVCSTAAVKQQLCAAVPCVQTWLHDETNLPSNLA